MAIRTSATTFSISLPRSMPHIAVEIKAAASSMTMHIPDGVAAHIRVDKSMSSAELDPARFPSTGNEGEYRSPEYESALHRADIRVSLGLGAIKFV